MEHKPYHHGNLREALIEAGIELINEEGQAGFSLREVAKRCGVSHGAPYNHFQSKEDLMQAMQQYVTDRFTHALKQSVGEDTENPQALHALGEMYVRFFAENPHYYQFFVSQPDFQVDINDWQAANAFPPYVVFRETALRCMRRIGIPEEHFTVALIMDWSIVHGLAGLSAMKGIRYDGDWGDLLQQMFDLENKQWGKGCPSCD